ncbi:hypothetical protein [Pseudoalteromonas sp. SK18]|uniref:hypothetical protein n=1 Tax=Pseudoalteromonas sp. SK18 TaxID=1938366 RepID=UPI0020C9B8D1|nr:hypothetical protein [Pseudoalteromonas sp. SK18]
MAAEQECTLQSNALPEQIKDYTQCLDAKLNKVQQQQDSWIQKRTFELAELESETGNTYILSLFKQSLNAKDKYIQKSCQWRYMLKQPNSPEAVVTYKECEIAMIEQFIQQLKMGL